MSKPVNFKGTKKTPKKIDLTFNINMPGSHECQICGKTDENVIMFIGGFFGWAHEECAELANKAVGLYLRCLGNDQGMTRFASDYLENEGFNVHFSEGTKVE